MIRKSVDSNSVVKCSIELYKWREYECSISNAVNCNTAKRSVLSLTFSGKSHANCHDRVASGVLPHALSNIALNLSNTSAQWYNSHLPMFHDFIEHISANSWSLSAQFFNFSINCLQSFGYTHTYRKLISFIRINSFIVVLNRLLFPIGFFEIFDQFSLYVTDLYSTNCQFINIKLEKEVIT